MADDKRTIVNYQKWCLQLAMAGYVTTGLIVIAHIVWYFAARSILAWPPDVYLRNYIILPAVGLFALTAFVDRIIRSPKTPLSVKEYLAVLSFVASAFYLTMTHDISKVLLCSYVLPIFASAIFSDKRLTRRIVLTSVFAVLITGGNSYLNGTLDRNLIMEIFDVCFIFVCTYYLVKILIQFTDKNLEIVKKANEEALRNELAFYQAQIQPHFLCNAINTIVSLCYTDGEKAAELLANLTNYLRFTFDFDSRLMMITLDEEMQLINAYVELEKARFGDLISVEYHIDMNLLGLKVPSFCLQPLVENAIKHGLRGKAGGGTVIISAQKERDSLVLSVIDNGVGISEEKMEQLIHNTGSGEGVGLYNVKRRVMGWKSAQFDIQSTEGKGTSIIMKISDAVT